MPSHTMPSLSSKRARKRLRSDIGIQRIVRKPLERQGFHRKPGEAHSAEAGPDVTFDIGEQADHIVLRQTIGVARIIAVADEASMLPVEFQQTGVVCGKPKSAFPVFEHSPYRISRRRRKPWFPPVNGKPCQGIRVPVEQGQAIARGIYDPEGAEAILVKRDAPGVRETGICRVTLPERRSNWSIPGGAAHPKLTIPVFARHRDVVAAEAGGIVRIVTVMARPACLWIEFVQAVPVASHMVPALSWLIWLTKGTG